MRQALLEKLFDSDWASGLYLSKGELQVSKAVVKQ
jgi:hypothetical protein